MLAGIGLAAAMGHAHLAVLTLSAAIGVWLYLVVADWMVVVLLDMALMWLLLRLFKMHLPAVYAFPLLAYVFPQEALPMLPVAALVGSLFSLGLALAYRMAQGPRLSLGHEVRRS